MEYMSSAKMRPVVQYYLRKHKSEVRLPPITALNACRCQSPCQCSRSQHALASVSPSQIEDRSKVYCERYLASACPRATWLIVHRAGVGGFGDLPKDSATSLRPDACLGRRPPRADVAHPGRRLSSLLNSLPGARSWLSQKSVEN